MDCLRRTRISQVASYRSPHKASAIFVMRHLLAAVTFILSASANAAFVTISATGTAIDSPDLQLLDDVNVGDQVRVALTYDSTISPQFFGGGTIAFYQFAVVGGSIQFQTASVSGGANGSLDVHNERLVPNSATSTVFPTDFIGGGFGLDAPQAILDSSGNYRGVSATLQLLDNDAQVFDTTDLPLNFDADEFDWGNILVSWTGTSGQQGFSIEFELDLSSVRIYVAEASITTDVDSDGVFDIYDNCTLVANGPDLTDLGGNSQLDTDGDGYGNYCDADFNNDGNVNFADLAALKAAFGTANANVDMDGNGFVNFGDLAVFKSRFGQPPGPSGLAP